ncbi:hypothetical protein DC522_33010 [Microvirga sp. KLBC 81]|nr:hypothetical protein DC522_33010 [Microvirga sp. KLBC 81]
MARVAKKATQDGTFTVYVEETPSAWGLTSAAADILMQRLSAVETFVKRATRGDRGLRSSYRASFWNDAV